MVKGYEFSKDQYVAFTAEELKAMEEQAQKAIEITEFVPASAVDPVFFDKAYYLGPEKGGEKAYKLLVEAMRQTGKTALAKWAARGKQYLVMIRPAPRAASSCSSSCTPTRCGPSPRCRWATPRSRKAS